MPTFHSQAFTSTGEDASNAHLFKLYSFSFKTPKQAAQVASYITLLCPTDTAFLELGLNEIFINAIEHGNLGLNAQDKSQYKNTAQWQNLVSQKLMLPMNLHKEVYVTVEVTPQSICIEVTDQGEGFDWQSVLNRPISPTQPSGRGLLLASELSFDEIEFLGKGNRIRCVRSYS